MKIFSPFFILAIMCCACGTHAPQEQPATVDALVEERDATAAEARSLRRQQQKLTFGKRGDDGEQKQVIQEAEALESRVRTLNKKIEERDHPQSGATTP